MLLLEKARYIHQFRRDDGAQARKDYPERDDKRWIKHMLAWIGFETREVKLDYRPLHTYTLTNHVQYIEPKKRVY